jgi:hypothetical protein
MIRDLRTILEGWNYEPGKISVRKIIGSDGHEKIQTRIDLGLLQIEPTGRPDGTRPHGYESVLDHYEQKLRDHMHRAGSEAGFTLNPDACADLRHEAYLYYQRYLSLFVLEEFDGVERDTARNLRVADLCHRYAVNPTDRQALEPQRAYVLMMNTRARAYGLLQRGAYEAALAIIDLGMAGIRKAVCKAEADAADDCAGDGQPVAELRILEELRTEVYRQIPPDCPTRLRWELADAVSREDYERAALLRNRLKAEQAPKKS